MFKLNSFFICFLILFSQDGLKPGLQLDWQVSMLNAREQLRNQSFHFNSTTHDIKTSSLNYTGGQFLDYEVDNWAFGFYKDKFYTHTINLKQRNNAKAIYQQLIKHFTSLYGIPLNDLDHIRDRRTFKSYYWYIKRSGKKEDVIELSTWQYKGVHLSINFYYGDLLSIVSDELKSLGM